MFRHWFIPTVLAFVSVGSLSVAGGPSAARGTDDLSSVGDWTSAFERIAATSAPSVVSINSVRRPGTNDASGLRRNELPPQLRGFPGELPFLNPRALPQENLGAGFVIREDGYIATNHHVVDAADRIEVTFEDGTTLQAELVGSDAKTDVAVVRVDAVGLPALELGDSDDLRPGQWIAAIGNPFGLTTTITSGIVSATGRTRLGITDYEDFIQTDAAINPGNSGGPMLDLFGRVIGINSAIFSRSGGSMGIGFAIPINLARQVIEDLIEDGRVQRGWLGVSIQSLDHDLAASFGRDDADGALVSDVVDDSPAARSHVRPGDIILRVGDDEIESANALRFAIAALEPGTRTSLDVWRDGELQSLDVELGDLGGVDPTTPAAIDRGDLGLELRDLTPEVRRQLGLAATETGVVVAAVQPYSPAAKAGLTVGDVIQSVAGYPVDSRADFRRALGSTDDGAGVRLVVRDARGGKRFVFLRVETRELVPQRGLELR